ncbi:Protein POF1B, partial [Lemmus lemmus]
MMSSSYWSESSSGSCGTQQPTEVLQYQPQHYHCFHQSSQGQQPPEKSVVYERVRTYSGPMNKVVQALDPLGSREVLSPLKTASSYQNLVWSDHSQELHSPTLKISTCAPSTLHITQNAEQLYGFHFSLQELHSPTVKVTTYPQTTIRRYIVQNPEQEPLSPFLRGGHFFPGNNVIYEKTIRKVEKLNTDQVIIQDDGPEKLDPKYFGELLADLSRKNTDLYNCLLEHLERIGGSKQDFESADASLENDKIRLEKDLAFKENQIKEYEELLASVRANNRQQQILKPNIYFLLNNPITDSYFGFVQVSETCTGPILQAKMDEIGNHYMEMVKNLRIEKDREISKLRSQLNQYQKDVSKREGSCSDFQFKLHELTSLLEEKDSLIKRQSE